MHQLASFRSTMREKPVRASAFIGRVQSQYPETALREFGPERGARLLAIDVVFTDRACEVYLSKSV
jgi:hypothetical protein